jgi:SAM-dependent methyltransferase
MQAGIRNLWVNRSSLGWKKTIGKILQPVNMYTRFPEYELFHSAVQPEVSGGTEPRREVLDVGSPKLLGFYLAARYGIRVHLTDLNIREIEEYPTMWSALRKNASGEAVFERQDARALTYESGVFDVVYSMSAIEHVEGEEGDSVAVREMWRVLKPSGLLVISVPFGDRYEEQTKVGFSYGATRVDSRKEYFFQRIYNRRTVEARLLAPLEPLPAVTQVRTVFRSRAGSTTTAYHRLRRLLGTNVGGVLGLFNPLLSTLLNRHCQGYAEGFLVSYGPIHSLADVYADAVVVCRKPGGMSDHVESSRT